MRHGVPCAGQPAEVVDDAPDGAGVVQDYAQLDVLSERAVGEVGTADQRGVSVCCEYLGAPADGLSQFRDDGVCQTNGS
jgi:hypothetical protein